jgi:hypothetical protein
VGCSRDASLSNGEIIMAYNGWTNYQTWNVVLWIDNDEGLYNLRKELGNDYNRIVSFMESNCEGDIRFRTPDGVSWNDSGINVDEINRNWADE